MADDVNLDWPVVAPIFKGARGRSSRAVEQKEVIPPFLSVRVFEAAARSGSFTRAAEELGITGGAVSQHIRVLEEFAGQPLFRRLGRGVELTDAGHAAFSHASAAIAEMLQAGRAMRASMRGRRVSISTAPSFASKWLIPRLNLFQDLYPEVEVRMSADMTLVDFATTDIDLAVRYGAGGYEGLHCERLMSESVTVVASPRLLERRPPIQSAADLIDLPLIHDEAPERDPSCPTWSMWFAARGHKRDDAERGLRFNQSSLALEAAVAGKGLVLAKRQLALRDLADGALVAPLEEAHAPLSFAYWLVWPRGRRFEPAQAAFLAWLREQVIESDSVADQTA
ncbi:MAG: transcriptional regulator GcvA [Hyphomonadaceae bacterium]|nr:transcriptional regulator GcvA [Hyphomonadaceae bacterium]